MKKLVTLIMLVTAASAFSQGQISFSTKTSGVDAPVTYGGDALGLPGPVPIGTVAGLTNGPVLGNQKFGDNARAGLYGGPDGSTAAELVLLTPSVPFRNDGTFRGYVDTRTANGGVPRTTSMPAGSFGMFQVRAWDTGLAQTGTSTYEDAMNLLTTQSPLIAGGMYEGVSALVRVGPLTVAPTTPPTLVGVTAWSMTFHPVPEPSIIGLGLLGAFASLLVFRRRN